MDYYLKANSENELWTTLVNAGIAVQYDVKDENGNVIETRYKPALGYDIDVIGTVYKPTGNFITTELGEVPEVEALDGYHANLRGNLTTSPSNQIADVEMSPIPGLTQQSLALAEDPSLAPQEQTIIEMPNPIAEILVYPKNPVRKWA